MFNSFQSNLLGRVYTHLAQVKKSKVAEAKRRGYEESGAARKEFFNSNETPGKYESRFSRSLIIDRAVSPIYMSLHQRSGRRNRVRSYLCALGNLYLVEHGQSASPGSRSSFLMPTMLPDDGHSDVSAMDERFRYRT